jgi:hypothetical protein
MPNNDNIQAPALILGSGRTASSYVISHLQHSVGLFQEVIENDVYRVLYENCCRSWWSKDWHWMGADESEVFRRTAAAIREVLLQLFPSSKPRWAMKMIWEGHEPEVVDAVFPKARFLHLIRDPRANIPSIVERIGSSQAEAEARYVAANATALAFERFGNRYMRLRQEEFDSDREGAWQRICAFLEVPFRPEANWAAEVNVSKSQVGKRVHTRPEGRMEWKSLSNTVRKIAKLLGFRGE